MDMTEVIAVTDRDGDTWVRIGPDEWVADNGAPWGLEGLTAKFGPLAPLDTWHAPAGPAAVERVARALAKWDAAGKFAEPAVTGFVEGWWEQYTGQAIAVLSAAAPHPADTPVVTTWLDDKSAEWIVPRPDVEATT